MAAARAHKPEDPELPSLQTSLLRLACRAGLLLIMVLGAHWLIDWSMAWTETLPEAIQASTARRLMITIFTVYALMIAVPFVPGIEIALALLMLRGAELALPLYLATLGGLFLAFAIGRLVPLPALGRLFLDLRLRRAAALIDTLTPLPAPARVSVLKEAMPQRFAKLVLNYRYLGLALLINLPGSALIGGGGGISMVAGMSGLFSTRATLPTMALAIAPFPLLVWLAGTHGWMIWIPG